MIISLKNIIFWCWCKSSLINNLLEQIRLICSFQGKGYSNFCAMVAYVTLYSSVLFGETLDRNVTAWFHNVTTNLCISIAFSN